MEDEKIMLDIIIPAYDCKDTLPRALSSIVAQTKKEKCIVTVVDDCSTEDLRPIIDDFKKYIKINYIKLDQNLKYPGLVRQIGLENSVSPYIMFLDADDMLSSNAVEMANREMLNTDRDVIIGYFYCQDEKGNIRVMKEQDTTWLHGNVYRRKFLEDNKISFPSGYNEDGAFNTQCYMLSDKIGILKTPMSYWLHHKESITRKETYFSLRYADQVISTLQFAYQNIFAHNGNKEKVLKNMGTHFALFFKLINDSINLSLTDSSFEIINENIEKALKDFVSILQINQYKKEELDWIKQGFIKGYLRYACEKMIIDPNFFFESINLKEITLEVQDFNGGC